MSLIWVVSYDVRNNKRRSKVYRMLTGYGRPVQYSVFECHIDGRKCAELEARVRELIKLDEDNVRFYPLDEATKARVVVLGKFQMTTDDPVVVLTDDAPAVVRVRPDDPF